MNQVSAEPSLKRTNEFLGHPKGLYVCFFTELWERFSFYGMKALLFLYLIKYHLFTDEHGYNLLGAYGALVYALPIVGGILADRYLGMRKSVIFGAILLVLGHIGMAYEGHKASLVNGELVRDEVALQFFYLSLALIIMGVGFLKPNISTIVGKLYKENDPRRDSGFTLFYMGINVGAFIAPLICAYLGETYGWKYGFGLAGIGMFAGLIVFISGQKYLYGHAEAKNPELLKQKIAGIPREYWIYFGSLVGLLVVWLLVQTHSLTIAFIGWLPAVSPVVWFLHSIAIVAGISITWYMVKYCNKAERQQMIALFIFIIGGLLFFSLYEQTYSSWLAFSDRVMDRTTFGFEWTAGQLTSTGAMFIILLSPFFAWLWPALARKNLNPSTPLKFAIGLAFAGLAFAVLAWGTMSPNEAGLVSVWYLIGAYFVLELGELSLSPIGLSAVTKLSVKKIVSLMMGAWFLGTSYSEIVAAELSKLSAIETHGGKITDVGEALGKYQDLFILSAKIGLATALVYFLLTPFIKKLMHGID
ncbi:peptide MFS transporter [Aliikangiella coralliicola]|uniref:MFS transporter n=1 Tax=Aliikangiella coralliicola TaxID=2592383 RepID=A0A545UBM6_9GAMM|nr:oligopeptide:H+ symporter [Aliikangiella coralliicola]TQV86870.1 MFS transporter [Aliikangiella coralliicola]